MRRWHGSFLVGKRSYFKGNAMLGGQPMESSSACVLLGCCRTTRAIKFCNRSSFATAHVGAPYMNELQYSRRLPTILQRFMSTDVIVSVPLSTVVIYRHDSTQLNPTGSWV